MLTLQQLPKLGKEVLQDSNLAQVTEQQIQELKESLWEHGVIVVRK